MAKQKNPAYENAKKYEGLSETDPKMQKAIVPFWKKVGLPGYKTIVGSAFAWCALLMVMANTNVGQQAILTGGAAAYNWRDHGQAIDWKVDGIPQGAEVRINHKGVCNSWANNHIAYADGDCTAADLLRKGGSIALFGGNQGNMVKRSVFGAGEICNANWPDEIPKPGKITESRNCTGAKSAESTR